MATTVKAGRKGRHSVHFPNSELQPHGCVGQGHRGTRNSVPPSGFWLQGADSQWVTPTHGSHAGLRQIWVLPCSLSPGLPGPAQKQKDTSASDKRVVYSQQAGGRRAEGSLPSRPHSRHYPHTHMQPGMGPNPRLGHQPAGPGGDELGSHKITGQGVTVVAAGRSPRSQC